MKRPDIIRTAEEVSIDLAKGLQFSFDDLRSFRKGILPAWSCQLLLRKVLTPVLTAAALIVVPLFGAAYFSSSSQQVSIFDGLAIVVTAVGHIKDMADSSGWFRTILYFVVGIGCVGSSFYYLTKVPLALFFDILAKQVRISEGRVNAREEEKAGKRDEVITYYFDMKDRRFEVPRPAFNALDGGGAYRVYYLPRSGMLVAIEPTSLAKEAEEKGRRLETGPVTI